MDCRGRLLDSFQPTEKEERAVAFTSWNGHAYFYKSARAVASCDEAPQRPRYRRLTRDTPVLEFKDWQPWDGEIASGYFWTEDIRGARADLLAHGHHPKVSMRGSALRLRVHGGADCVIRELCEDAAVLQQWTERLGVPYRGQRLAGASLEVFLHLLQGKHEDTRSRREELLAQQQGMCKLCGAPIALGTFEIDHIIPVSQSFSGQQLELQALCLECHRTKTSLEGNHCTTLESRFCRYAYQNYATSPRLPPLVFQLQKWDDSRPCQGIDVRRCRKNGLANARFPLPVFCPLDCIVRAEEGKLADLTWVELPCDRRRGVLDRLPYVGRGWYPKPVCAYMLEAGLAKWSHFKWSLDATAHVDQRCLELVLERMEQSWPEGEEHYAKLAINSLVGLFARNLELVYSMKTSNHQVDGEGCSWRQTFTDSAGRTHWDHIFVTELLSNSSYRPIHDYIMGAEYVAVARIRQALADVPKRYLKSIKTDCLVMQDVPKKYRPAVERLLQMSHRDGTPIYRYEDRGGRIERAVSRAQHGSAADPSEAAVASSRRPCGPLPGRREPAANGLSGNGEDSHGQEDRRSSEGARGHRAHHHQNACGSAKRGPGGSDGGPLGAEKRARRALQRHVAGHRRADAIGHSAVGRHRLPQHEQEDSLLAARGLSPAARRLG